MKETSRVGGLSPTLASALTRSLQRATPWWVRVRVTSRPDGYRLRVFCLRPPHFPAESSTVTASGDAFDPASAVCGVLETVQQYIGREWGRAWPGGGWLPDPARADDAPSISEVQVAVTAWFDAFPKPQAVIEGTTLRAWYGDEAAPVLDLGRLPLN
jgi:hypothetical protein